MHGDESCVPNKPGGRRIKRVIRSTGAVIAGALAITIPSIIVGYVLKTFLPGAFAFGGPNPNSLALVFTLIYSIFFSGIGGYVTARIAQRSRTRSVIALAVLQLIVGTAAATQTSGLLPNWFSIAVDILPVPAILLGGALKSRTF